MLRLNVVNLDENPNLIQPPKVDDNIVIISLVSDKKEIIAADIIDVALSYSVAGIDVVLEMPFEIKKEFNNKQLASLICNGGWSLSLLAPKNKNEISYCKHVIEWYKLWRSETMVNFEKSLYPITSYVEYLTVSHLINKHKKDLKNEDILELVKSSQNPNDLYVLDLISNMDTSTINKFKQQLKNFIKQYDQTFYNDIDLLTDQITI
jgi:hypothetical protein